MSPEQIELIAAKGEKAPSDLTPPEVMLYHTLAALYARYRAGGVSIDEARSLKRSILTAYRRMNSEYRQYIEICREYQKRLRDGYKIGEREVV